MNNSLNNSHGRCSYIIKELKDRIQYNKKERTKSYYKRKKEIRNRAKVEGEIENSSHSMVPILYTAEISY